MKKKTKAKAKKAKGATTSVSAKKGNTEIVVRVEQAAAIPPISEREIAEPISEGSKYALAPTWLSEKQIMRMVATKTPRKYVYTRPGKGGQSFEYVTGNYMKKVLNFIFGFNWDFEVVDKGREGDQIWVQGKLTVRDNTGKHSIVKTQFGRADIKFKRDSKIMLDYGNDLKAATTDALKKCASELGIAQDIYGKEEAQVEGKQIEATPVEATVSPESAPKVHAPTSAPAPKKDVVRCQVGGEVISEAEARFSMSVYGRPLCREHQKGAKRK